MLETIDLKWSAADLEARELETETPETLLRLAREKVGRLKAGAVDLLFLFGVKPGYQIQALGEKWPKIRIAVFDPILGPGASHAIPESARLSDNRLTVIEDWDSFHRFLTEQVVYGDQADARAMITPGYQIHTQEVQAFELAVKEARLWRAVIDKTTEEKGALALKNLAANVPSLLRLPPITDLNGRYAGRPGFIVGSGPSLARNGHLLKRAQGQGLVLAASSALQPLAELGVKPDLVVVIEPEDTSDYLRLAHPWPDLVLAAASTAHPAHFQVPELRGTTFHLNRGAAHLFGFQDWVPQGGTSGSAAFTLGFLLGLSPLILIGQDQAYDSGRLHTPGTPGEDDLPLDPGNYRVHGVSGQPVQTHSGFVASLHWYVEAIRYVRSLVRETIILNASEGGATIPGVRNESLADIFDQMPTFFAPPPALGEFLDQARRPNPREVRIDLTQALEIIHGLTQVLNRRSTQAASLYEEARGLHPFLQEALPRFKSGGLKAARAALDRTKGLLKTMMAGLD